MIILWLIVAFFFGIATGLFIATYQLRTLVSQRGPIRINGHQRIDP